MSTSPPEDELRRVVDVANENLQKINPTPFSANAFNHLNENISKYIIQLMTESIKVARRHQSEQVSPADVEHAAQYLGTTSTRKAYRHMGTVGGILLGAVGSNLISMTTTHQFTVEAILVTFALTLIGAFLVAIHIVKD